VGIIASALFAGLTTMSTLRILTVCTHNRTRSVVMAALLEHHLVTGELGASVTSAGFRDEGLPATTETVRLLAQRGLDVNSHQSRRVTPELIDAADLVVTAEREHVLKVAVARRDAFARTFTLPELLRWSSVVGPRRAAEWSEWLGDLALERPRARAYLAADIGEIEDPTGRALNVWERTIQEVDAMCEQLAAVIR
jgi:protein-tyrosine phosphatase